MMFAHPPIGPAFLLLSLLSAVAAPPPTGIPAERPRARPASALTGWADWEKGAELFKRIKVPPAPVQSPQEEAASFKLAPGFRAELVACEPMVQCPIFFEFDARGRIWVVEYQGYMRDLQGSAEGEPICRVVVLEDRDQDGRADQSTVFLDKLVMPRSLALVKGGVLIQEPPRIWFCEDRDGDLRCDAKREVGRMGVAGNPQHTANGLRLGIDNWLHCADWPKRYQWRDGKLIEEDTLHRGQFGVSFDERGRFISCYENSAMHLDVLPAHALLRHPHLAALAKRGGRGSFGVNVNVARDAAECFPIRVTPAVTLGALELRDDGRLRTYTIVSGTCFYDGDQFPATMRGTVIVPDSAGHLLGTLKLRGDLPPRASRFFAQEQELLASRDERFRPVNARVGPDGALYVADLYHGIIEHVIFMVPWLSQQIRERRLDEGNDRGRLWRIVHEGQALRPMPNLEAMSDAQLVEQLSHANGWQRQCAQRLLVERGGNLGRWQNLANPFGRLHALWTLQGQGRLQPADLAAAARDEDERVREAAAQLGAAVDLRREPSAAVRLQALLHPQPLADLAWHLSRHEDDVSRVAAMSRLHRHEAQLLDGLLTPEHWAMAKASVHAEATLSLLAQLLMMDQQGKALLSRIEALSPQQHWQREALLDGLLASGQKLELAQEPAFLALMKPQRDLAARERLQRLRLALHWPGSSSAGLNPQGQSLSAAAQAQVQRGAQLYGQVCGLCHQTTGFGVPGVAPPLAGSSWVTGEPGILIRIALQGLYGEIEVNGQRWNLAMPGQGHNPMLGDEQLADVLTYIRNAWDNTASPIEAALVAKVREATRERQLPWTAATLLQLRAPQEQAIVPDAQGQLHLHAKAAQTFGQKLAYRPALDILAPWRLEGDIAQWVIEPKAGRYEVLVTLAADEASAGDAYRIQSQSGHLRGEVRATGDYQHFEQQRVGVLELKAGRQVLLMQPDGTLKQELADVRALTLRPLR